MKGKERREFVLDEVYDLGGGYVTACLRCFGQCSHKSCSSSSFFLFPFLVWLWMAVV
jgi:hypothetical protein